MSLLKGSVFMKKYVLITDSCIDLPLEIVERYEMVVLPLSVNINGKEYKNYLDEREIKFKKFYDMLREKAKTSTSMATPNDFIETFEKYVEQGYDILSISFSSNLSGTYNSSLIAKAELEEKYPDNKIITIDSLCASMGQGLLLTYAGKLREEGKSIDEVAAWVEENKLNICHLFTVGDLNHLRRGGRLSYSKALIAQVLRIKPVLHVNKEGKLVQVGIARGRQSSIKSLIDRLKKTIQNPEEQIIYISHGDCLEEVEKIKEKIKNELNPKEIVINYIGPVIGSHSGLDTIAIFYLGNDRFLNY